MTAATSVRWAPVYTASKWVTVVNGMRDTLAAKKMTNRNAVSFIREWNNVSPSGGKTLWAQFAAVAYGWTPERDQLVRSSAQGDAAYIMPSEVFSWAESIARELDERADVPPRISVNNDTWSDPTFYGAVRSQLQQDGARASFKIPLPTCRDKKTGKVRFPRPGDNKNTCEPVIVDDPVTVVGNHLSILLLVLGAVWLLTAKDSRNAAHR